MSDVCCGFGPATGCGVDWPGSIQVIQLVGGAQQLCRCMNYGGTIATRVLARGAVLITP